MRLSIAHGLRRRLAALLVGLLVLVSADPCVSFAAAAPGHPAIAAPADPCKARHRSIPCACAQLSCQHFAAPALAVAARVETPSEAAFTVAAGWVLGRTEAPPLPPPRHP